MALVKCPECGKEISDTSKRCPHCGYREKKKINKKVFLIGGIIIALLITFGIVFSFINREKPLTELEQKAVDCVLDYKSMLKNPGSLQVHDIRWAENNLVDGMIFIYLDVSGQNGFGGNNRHIVRYGIKDEEINFQGSDDDNDSSWEKLVAKKIRTGWEELNHDDTSVISTKRVMKKVNVDE